MGKIFLQWAGVGILSLVGWGVAMMPNITSWIPSVIIWSLAFVWLVATLVYLRRFYNQKEFNKVSTDEKQQPNIHVESHHQQGGITAYQVNIQPGDRKLSDNVTKQLEDYLKSVSYKSVEVTAVMGDGEAFRFASQIKNFLTSKGIDVKGVNQAIYTTPMQGQIIEPPNDAGVVKIIIGNR